MFINIDLVRHFMNSAINLYAEFSFFGIKIRNKAFDNLLPPEFYIARLPAAKLRPKLLFGWCQVPSKCPRLCHLDIGDRLKPYDTAGFITGIHSAASPFLTSPRRETRHPSPESV